MQRSKDYLAGADAAWNERDTRWAFPSGATVTFGFLEHERDKYRYASAGLQYVGLRTELLVTSMPPRYIDFFVI
jgi:hypothetical protein